ncbi:MAG TPA: class I SAM-dependent methyltransferase [Sphingomonadaceae bacterium]
MNEAADALGALLRYLDDIGYHFVTPTPATHARVLARDPARAGKSPQEVLGWSLPFASGGIDPAIEALLAESGVVEPAPGGLVRSTVRVSTVAERLFLHSAYPTTAADSVFLGPDTYRFVQLIRGELQSSPPSPDGTIVDIGTGSGAGAVVAADLCPAARIAMTDLNSRALELAAINARHAGHTIGALEGRNLAGLEGEVEVALANPPYVIDPAGRTYRHGGDMHGAEISVEIAKAALDTLRPGGRLILYTGSAIVAGEDRLRRALEETANSAGTALRYWEIDPDVFGEELENAEYRDVDRIAVVAAIFSVPRS